MPAGFDQERTGQEEGGAEGGEGPHEHLGLDYGVPEDTEQGTSRGLQGEADLGGAEGGAPRLWHQSEVSRAESRGQPQLCQGGCVGMFPRGALGWGAATLASHRRPPGEDARRALTLGGGHVGNSCTTYLFWLKC